MRGRKPLPINKRKLEGNRSKRRLPVEPEILPVAALGLPEWFPASAQAFYARYAPEIRRLAGAGESDEAAMQAMALAWGLAMDAARSASKRRTARDVNGQMRKNPALQVWRDNLQLWVNLAARFGLTPADRARMFGKHAVDEKPSGLLNGQWSQPAARVN